jgi:hypothetical protein
MLNSLGDLASSAVGGSAAKGGSRLVRAGAGLLKNANKAADIYGKGKSAYNIARGCGTPGDLLNLANGLNSRDKNIESGSPLGINNGRSGKQQRLRELAQDPKTSSTDRAWIKQDIKAIEEGKRKSIRNPPGKDLAHERGREAAKGYGYEHSNLQDRDLHRLQHRYDNYGRSNKERPINNGI